MRQIFAFIGRVAWEESGRLGKVVTALFVAVPNILASGLMAMLAESLGMPELASFTMPLIWSLVIALLAICGLLIWTLARRAFSLEESRKPAHVIDYTPDHPFIARIENARYEPGLSDKTGPSLFYRVLIDNPKPNTVVSVDAPRLTEVERLVEDQWRSTFGDTLTLRWAAKQDGAFDTRKLTFADRCFVDVFSVDPYHNCIELKDREKLLVNETLFTEPGPYRLTISVSDTNGIEVQERFILVWSGQWDKTQFLMEAEWQPASS